MKTFELSYYCELSWADLPGNSNTIRHCGQCDTKVYNLSAMTEAQAARLLSREGAPPCVHFVSRDGRIVHDGDPLEQLRKQRRGAKKLLAGALAVQAVFMAVGEGERVFLDPFILGVTTVVKTYGETVEEKFTMGAAPVSTEVTF